MISVPYTIKELYHQDHCYKNIRIHFPNGERTDICNDLIVKDSVSFTESLCSQNTLKFGLCESPIFECEVVGVGNIKGATIEVSVEIECPFSAPGAEWKTDLQKYVYSIPYGAFVVDSCKRQADMIHRKIIAYNSVAVNAWEVGEIEKLKYNLGGNYTPNIGYFAGACGVPMITTVCDEDSFTWDIVSGNRIFAVDNVQTYLEVNYTAFVIQFYRSSVIDTLYQCDYPIKTTAEEIEKNLKYADRGSYQQLTEASRKMAKSMSISPTLTSLYPLHSGQRVTGRRYCADTQPSLSSPPHSNGP